MIQPGETFKENLQQLPPVDGVQRIDLVDGKGDVVACIENQPGKQGSLAVYQYLKQAFGVLDEKAAHRVAGGGTGHLASAVRVVVLRRPALIHDLAPTFWGRFTDLFKPKGT